jgi:hypothetical protein
MIQVILSQFLESASKSQEDFFLKAVGKRHPEVFSGLGNSCCLPGEFRGEPWWDLLVSSTSPTLTSQGNVKKKTKYHGRLGVFPTNPLSLFLKLRKYLGDRKWK